MPLVLTTICCASISAQTCRRTRTTTSAGLGSAAVFGEQTAQIQGRSQSVQRYIFFGASSFFIVPLSFFAMSAHIASFCESFFVASFAAIAM